jgi:hypothetical protein
MAVSSLLKEALSKTLEKYDCRRKTNSWYCSNDETVIMVNLQKSQYGEQYYVNFGIALRQLVPEQFPKEQHCNIRFRLASVVPQAMQSECQLAFDLENNAYSDKDRIAVVVSLVEGYGIPILLEGKSVASIAAAYKKKIIPEWAFSRKAIELLCQ